MRLSALDRRSVSVDVILVSTAEVPVLSMMPSLRERPSDLLTISQRRVRRAVLVVVPCLSVVLVGLSFK
jgi:hypothetical protein